MSTGDTEALFLTAASQSEVFFANVKFLASDVVVLSKK